MRINLSTRLLHFGMVVVVSYQMISSVFMTPPEPGKMTGIDTTLFYLHVTVFGWAAIIFSGVYALTRFNDSHAWGRLVPWFRAAYRVKFFASARKELPDILRGRLAPPEEKGALAGAVHGFGFLLLLGLGLSGIYVLLGLRTDGTMAYNTLLLLDFHQLCGVLIWGFLAAHIIMTLYHLVLGQYKAIDIFKCGRIPWK